MPRLKSMAVSVHGVAGEGLSGENNGLTFDGVGDRTGRETLRDLGG